MIKAISSVLLLAPLHLAKAWFPPAIGKRFHAERFSTSVNVLASPEQAMGIPSHLEAMVIGHRLEGLLAGVTVEKISSKPPIFVLRNVLSNTECQSLTEGVSELQPGRTVNALNSEIKRKFSSVGWVDNEVGSVTYELAEKMHSILMPNQIFDVDRGVEPMQVVRYEEGGEYVLHHDSKQRLLTVLYYLNGSGETWFPLADSQDAFCSNRFEALKLCETKHPTESGVLVSCEGRGVQVQKGDAVAFFNYFENGCVDWKAIHAGLPTSSTKWIANHWYHHFPFSFH
mmetsp:Transcript_2717/g.3659  ORF Transcript_2717/g.3659 Transcript_2717/m.3659 type:complete len:285 (-) Transcript_2717:289-1143(-)